MLRQAPRQTRQEELRRRVVEQVSLAGGPLEERLQGRQERLLRAEGERGAVGLAVVIEIPLIPLEDRQVMSLGWRARAHRTRR